MIKNIFTELYKRYISKVISKESYIDLAYKNHDILFNYADYLKNTNIKSIQILDNEVRMMTRREKLILVFPRNDKRIVTLEILNFKNFEGVFFDFYLDVIKNAEVVFDIGANIGWHDLCAAKLNSKIKVFSFEPIKETFGYLLKNIEINNLINIIPNNIGLSNKNSTASFFIDPEHSGSASEKKITENNTKRIKVVLKKLDDYCQKNRIDKIDLIKCDVEGAELFVLKGGIKVLKELKPIILIEMLRKWSKKFGYHPNDIIDLMNSLDYHCYTFEGRKLKKIKTITEKTNATNFIFFHQIKHSNLVKKYENFK